jgi:hypothetical protein
MKDKRNNIVSALIVLFFWIVALALFYLVIQKVIHLMPKNGS